MKRIAIQKRNTTGTIEEMDLLLEFALLMKEDDPPKVEEFLKSLINRWDYLSSGFRTAIIKLIHPLIDDNTIFVNSQPALKKFRENRKAEYQLWKYRNRR